jgi:hypothetical protein
LQSESYCTSVFPSMAGINDDIFAQGHPPLSKKWVKLKSPEMTATSNG